MSSLKSADNSTKNKVGLISSEGDLFKVDIEVAKYSDLVKSMLSDDDNDDIPLPNVNSDVLAAVMEFCNYHIQNGPMAEITKPLKSVNMVENVSEWDALYINKFTQDMLFKIIMATNYMDINPLLNLACAKVASMLIGKTPEEIRATFNITNEFTPEEEAQVRQENKWAEKKL